MDKVTKLNFQFGIILYFLIWKLFIIMRKVKVNNI